LGNLGIRFNVFYQASNQDHPAKKILKPLIDETRFVKFIDRDPSQFEKRIFGKMMSLSQRFKKVHALPLLHDKVGPGVSDVGRYRKKKILIHTHLDGHHGWKGATAKIWRVENWTSVINQLNQGGYDVSILEWDKEARGRIMTECPSVSDLSDRGLLGICREMSQYACVVSVDSWVKYVAAWNQISQVILVPDLRNGYVPGFEKIEPHRIASWWFHGLLETPMNRVIGLEKVNGSYQYTLPRLNDFEPNVLVSEIMRCMK
jgi:ADP-heptose:LPS heptosyltransferase